MLLLIWHNFFYPIAKCETFHSGLLKKRYGKHPLYNRCCLGNHLVTGIFGIWQFRNGQPNPHFVGYRRHSSCASADSGTGGVSSPSKQHTFAPRTCFFNANGTTLIKRTFNGASIF